jgi:hypothetical protein
MLSHVARVSLFQNINERKENLCLEFFLDKIDYAVLKYLIKLIKFKIKNPTVLNRVFIEFYLFFINLASEVQVTRLANPCFIAKTKKKIKELPFSS